MTDVFSCADNVSIKRSVRSASHQIKAETDDRSNEWFSFQELSLSLLSEHSIDRWTLSWSVAMWAFKVLLVQLLLDLPPSSPCYLNDDEVLCHSFDFSYYNSSSMDQQHLFSSVQTLHLTNGYYAGLLPQKVKKLIIDDYPYERFPSPFKSPFSLNTLFIERTSLKYFPAWLCTFNENLSFIDIDDSHLEQISEHDLALCSRLHTLHISNSHLKLFSHGQSKNLSIHSLYLNDNHFSSIASDEGLSMDGLSRLSVLGLSNNQIKSISSEYLNHTTSLTTLDLSFNQVEWFRINQTRYLTSLEILDLRGNFYLQMDADWYNYFPHLIKAYFPDSHFCCHYKNNVKVFNKPRTKRSVSNQTWYEFLDTKSEATADEKQIYSISFRSDQVCFPLPDQMTPCESLFSTTLIRSIFLIIVFISVGSNLSALIINIIRLVNASFNRWSIPTVLSSNLALADFLSSIYLVLMGILDLRFDKDFHQNTQLWTKSSLCTWTGFIYIFGIQSSLYALTLLTFERFYTILFSFKRQTPWPPKFTLTSIAFGWLISFFIASLPLVNVNNFHANSLCVPFRLETLFDRIYLSLLIIFDLCSLGIIITCNGLICFNFSKSHVHTSNDARATLKILTLVVAICISRIPMIIYISLALVIHPTYSSNMNTSNLDFHDIKLAILFLQPFSSCFNPFMYSSLSTMKWTSSSGFERPRPKRKSKEFSRFRSQSERGYHPLRMMSITTLDYRLSSLPNTPWTVHRDIKQRSSLFLLRRDLRSLFVYFVFVYAVPPSLLSYDNQAVLHRPLMSFQYTTMASNEVIIQMMFQ